MRARTAAVKRTTRETSIALAINLDGRSRRSTPVCRF